MKRPAFQFYPGDWRREPALAACTLAARGLWLEMICIAHESEPYGHLCINGKPMTPAQIARMVGETPAAVAKLIAELEAAGVFSRDDGGAIFSRRMVRDERLRDIRSEAGRLGGNPKLLKQTDIQGVIPDLNQNGTPSSSSSTSIEEANASSSAKAAIPPCPHLKVIALYGEKLPTLPQPKPELWGGKKADWLRARWKWVLTAKRSKDQTRYATTEEEALDWFGRYFDYVGKSDFLMGRKNDFCASLQWLVNEDNFAKVVQGNYENKGAA